MVVEVIGIASVAYFSSNLLTLEVCYCYYSELVVKVFVEYCC